MIRKGTTVEWEWGTGKAKGEVKEIYNSEIEKKIKGSNIKRKGTESDPAYLIETEDGDEVLKLKSEVQRRD